jgi:hydroxyacylglutathione hydrolase
MILKRFICGPLDTNTYLITCEKTFQTAIIDPGLGSFKEVEKTIRNEDFHLVALFLTHSHWDHIADGSLFKNHFSLSVYVHKEDAKNVENPGSDQIPSFFSIPPLQPDRLLKGGEILSIGDIQIKVIHTPGHSPGSVCYYIPQEKMLFSGDTLFRGTIGNLSSPTASSERMWSSLKKLSLLPKDTIVYPGHGGQTSIGREKFLENPEEFF